MKVNCGASHADTASTAANAMRTEAQLRNEEADFDGKILQLRKQYMDANHVNEPARTVYFQICEAPQFAQKPVEPTNQRNTT
jgi:hypothetical protein